MIHVLHGYASASTSQDVGLFELELPGIAVRHLDPVYGLHHIPVRICLFCQEAIVGEFDIPGHQLSAVEGACYAR